MRYLRASVILFLIFFCLGPASASGQDTVEGAPQAVERLHGALIEAMKAGGGPRGYPRRREMLAPVVYERLDTAFIAMVAVGRYWKDFSEAQKEKFLSTFRDLSVATYASKFDSYSGESFSFISARDLGKGRVLVRTEFTKSDGEVLRFDYVLHNKGEGWKVINVVVDGVSDLSLKRAQYTSVVKDDGFDALIDKINEKIRGYEEEGG